MAVKRRWVGLNGGGQAIPLQIEYLCTFDNLVNALCWTQRDWSSELQSEPLPELTKARVENKIRGVLRYAGWESPVFWADGVRDDDVEIIRAWAERQIERTFGRPAPTRSQLPNCPSCGTRLDWVDDNYYCLSCGDEFGREVENQDAS